MSSRDRSILAALVLVVVAVGGYFLLVQPQNHKASQLQTQIATAQGQLATAKQQVQQGLAAEAEYEIYAKQLKSLQAAIPADTQIPALINELQAASSHTHTGFQAVTLTGTTGTTGTVAPAASTTSGVPAAAANFPSQSFTLQFNGTYFSVADLLGRLTDYVHADNSKFKASGRLLTISSVSFAAGATGFPSVTATITAVDYDIPSGLSGTSSSSTATSATN